MYNNNNNKNLNTPPTLSSPRISFSNDFAESAAAHHQYHHHHHRPNPSPVSSDFEFSVSNYSMMTADELFSHGKLLPFKNNPAKSTTLRDELLSGQDDNESAAAAALRPPKGSNRWKGFLGLRKSHVGIGSKKPDKGDGSGQQSSKEQLNDGGTS